MIPRSGRSRRGPAPALRAGPPRRNRRTWDRIAASYERRHAPSLRGARAMTWGVWRMPESRLRLLGPVAGRRSLELGCGAADWSIALGRRGARAIGMDFSRVRLAQGAENARRDGARLPLVQASAEDLPFGEAVFDLVFCDWGAMTFADPYRTVPEVARVLADGGRFVFATHTPLHLVTYDRKHDRPSRTLRRDYFGLHRIDLGDSFEFQLPYGKWVELFRRNGLRVESLVETRPAPHATSTYRTRSDRQWSRRWPAEAIWQVSRESRRTARFKSRKRYARHPPRRVDR